MNNQVILKNCQLVLEKGKSKKNNKEYVALYLITDTEEKIFLTFTNLSLFDNLKK